MFRTKMISGAAATLALSLMSSAALAQPADDRAPNGPPAQMNDQAYDNNADDRDAPPPPPPQQQAQNDQRARDLFCRRDAAARTGYVSPGQAASRAQTSGSVGGTVLGAVAGAAIGSASHNAGAGALIGAGAGLIAGTAIGQDNARRAASDVEHAYSDAYYACMDEADADDGPPPQYAQGAPPPRYGYDPYYYGPPPAYATYPYPYPYPYYGPSVSLGFGFGGYHRGFGGYRGGFRHR